MADVNLSDLIKSKHPKIVDEDFRYGLITLMDNSDGKGAFIKEWNYSEKLDDSLNDFYHPEW